MMLVKKEPEHEDIRIIHLADDYWLCDLCRNKFFEERSKRKKRLLVMRHTMKKGSLLYCDCGTEGHVRWQAFREGLTQSTS